jgi:hypothetical protein
MVIALASRKKKKQNKTKKRDKVSHANAPSADMRTKDELSGSPRLVQVDDFQFNKMLGPFVHRHRDGKKKAKRCSHSSGDEFRTVLGPSFCLRVIEDESNLKMQI